MQDMARKNASQSTASKTGLIEKISKFAKFMFA